jgi:uracil phosphoribosyltransferase
MLFDRSDCPVMQLLVDRTRRAEVRGPALAAAHRDVGAALASFAARRCDLEEVPIDHVAGASKGLQLVPASSPVLLVLMRAGLFVAEGVWQSLPGAALVPWDGRAESLGGLPLGGRPVMVIDSVINSGRSIGHALEAVQQFRPAWISVVALVANHEGLAATAARWPEVDFVIARVSGRSYVGKGPTDTGARLFGTTDWE